MRNVAALAVVGALAGCTSVKVVQRDGCWVRRTEKKILGTVSEEVGPCARPATAFVENDPLTRMVQECIARADYRWQMRALAAWDRREPWPAQLDESSVLQQCMDDSARGALGETAALKEKNAALEQRVQELTREQQALRQRSEAERRELVTRGDAERKELLDLQAKLGDHLGEAAKKVPPAPPPAIATATATSDGRLAADSQTPPATIAVLPQPGAPAGPVSASVTMSPPPASAVAAGASSGAPNAAGPSAAAPNAAGPNAAAPTTRPTATVQAPAGAATPARAPSGAAACPPPATTSPESMRQGRALRKDRPGARHPSPNEPACDVPRTPAPASASNG